MIILASASPRRTEILSTLGVEHIIFTANADESSDITDPHLLTKELAERKGLAVYEELKKNSPEGIDAERAVIISADTVVYANGKILGKPRDTKNAEEMLRSLSGKTHEVISGIAITLGGVTKSASVSTKVRVDDIPETELIAYANSGEPLDKAGAPHALRAGRQSRRQTRRRPAPAPSAWQRQSSHPCPRDPSSMHDTVRSACRLL